MICHHKTIDLLPLMTVTSFIEETLEHNQLEPILEERLTSSEMFVKKLCRVFNWEPFIFLLLNFLFHKILVALKSLWSFCD